MREMLLQIVDNGAISASWVLAGIASIAMFLIWNFINNIKSDVKEIKTDLKTLQINDATQNRRLDDIEKTMQDMDDNLADKIITKLKALQGE